MARKKAAPPMYQRTKAPAPDGLPESGKTLWRQIVAGFDFEHFSPADLPLLEEFIRCRLMIDDCNKELAANGLFVDGPSGIKPHPAVMIRDAQVRNMATLGAKLRLPVSSRIRAESASTRPSGIGVAPWEMDDLIAKPAQSIHDKYFNY